MAASGRSDLIDIAVTIKRRSEKAVLVDHGGKEDAWLPLSQIEIDEDATGTTITLPEWLAVDKGMI
jgi:hypothetical protein